MITPPERRLLIYIPTYNRFDKVMAQIRHIEAVILGTGHHLHVSDNCSTDARYQTLAEQVNPATTTVTRQPVNVGPDINMISGFLHSGGYDYFWLLSDDDMLLSDGVAQVLQLLATDPEMIYLRDTGFVQELTVETLDQNALLSIVNQGLGLISRVIYHTGYFLPYVKFGFEYLKSSFPHLATQFAAVGDRGTVKIASYPCDRVFVDEPLTPASSPLFHSIYYGVTLADLIRDPRTREQFILERVVGKDARGAIVFRDTHEDDYRQLLGYLRVKSFRAWMTMLMTSLLVSGYRAIGGPALKRKLMGSDR